MLTFNKAKPEDLIALSYLIKEVISHTKYYSKYAKDSEIGRFTSHRLRQYFLDCEYIIFVAKVDEIIVGFRIAQIDADILLLDWTGVKKEYRGQGIAKMMHKFTFCYVEDNLPFIHKIYCDSTIDNKESISLLKKMGFRKIAILKNHWYKLDYYLWEKPLLPKPTKK